MKPCPECPWSRTVTPGALGGSKPEVYIGQSVGPYILPCHKHCNFDDPEWRGKTIETPQCIGAAIFRANIGVAELMPNKLMRHPVNRELVFSDHAEFFAHHTGHALGTARKYLRLYGPKFWLELELEKQSKIIFQSGG